MCLPFQEAKAIIAQRSDNPREFFKNKERAMATSVDTSPVSIHRTGKETLHSLRVGGGQKRGRLRNKRTERFSLHLRDLKHVSQRPMKAEGLKTTPRNPDSELTPDETAISQEPEVF